MPMVAYYNKEEGDEGGEKVILGGEYEKDKFRLIFMVNKVKNQTNQHIERVASKSSSWRGMPAETEPACPHTASVGRLWPLCRSRHAAIQHTSPAGCSRRTVRPGASQVPLGQCAG